MFRILHKSEVISVQEALSVLEKSLAETSGESRVFTLPNGACIRATTPTFGTKRVAHEKLTLALGKLTECKQVKLPYYDLTFERV